MNDRKARRFPAPGGRAFPILSSFFLSTIVAGALFLPATAAAQSQDASPVFRSYRQPRPGGFVERSDVTYQLWRTFDLTRRAAAGDVLAQQELAIRYLTGRGTKADTTRGAFWTQKAAAQNLVPARFNLAILLTNGWGVEWDPFSAYEHFLWCAERGMPEAQYAVAATLSEDLVVARNPAEARQWLRAAADSGYVPARTLLGADETAPPDRVPDDHSGSPLSWSPVFIDFQADTARAPTDTSLLQQYLLRGMGTESGLSLSRLEEMDAEALARLQRHADAGSPEALVLLGARLQRGLEGRKDVVQAAACYLRALRLDAPAAGLLLMDLLSDSAAVTLLRTRIAEDDPAALFVVGTLAGLRLLHPRDHAGIRVTEEQAFGMLAQAAGRGYVPAIIEQGLWYYAGRAVAEDRERALRLWRDAADRGSVEAGVRRAAAELETDPAAVDILLAGMREGSLLAQVALGYSYEIGSGVARSAAAAARLYRNAAGRGSQDALRALLRLHDRIRPPGEMFAVPRR